MTGAIGPCQLPPPPTAGTCRHQPSRPGVGRGGLAGPFAPRPGPAVTDHLARGGPGWGGGTVVRQRPGPAVTDHRARGWAGVGWRDRLRHGRDLPSPTISPRGGPGWGGGTVCATAGTCRHRPSRPGWAGVGWRDRCAPWMAHNEPPGMGSRRVPPAHPGPPPRRKPEPTNPPLQLPLQLQLPFQLPLQLQLQLLWIKPPPQAQPPPSR